MNTNDKELEIQKKEEKKEEKKAQVIRTGKRTLILMLISFIAGLAVGIVIFLSSISAYKSDIIKAFRTGSAITAILIVICIIAIIVINFKFKKKKNADDAE